MEPYFTGNRRWPDGYSSLELYLLPNLSRDTALKALLDACGTELASFGTIAVAPPEWLHVTLQPIKHRPAEDIGSAERADLVRAITAALATVSPFTVQAGPGVAGTVGVVMDLHPDNDIDDLLTRVRTAISAVSGPVAVTYDTRPAHLTLGYALDHQDSGVVTSRLRRAVRPSHAPLTVDTVHLVEVYQDPDRGQFRWRPVHTFPLATRRPAATPA